MPFFRNRKIIIQKAEQRRQRGRDRVILWSHVYSDPATTAGSGQAEARNQELHPGSLSVEIVVGLSISASSAAFLGRLADS